MHTRPLVRHVNTFKSKDTLDKCGIVEILDVVERQQAKSASHLFYRGRSLAMLKGPRGRERDVENDQPVKK